MFYTVLYLFYTFLVILIKFPTLTKIVSWHYPQSYNNPENHPLQIPLRGTCDLFLKTFFELK